ncbi:hypothetical protein NIES2100_29100 [Calothrix sp. NIES-2100]|uniref:DUF2806 domain-containing protein n=1 Tax=Calothrix sp. NIES-2100 TaxID=1954172 RepID=UPI000B60645D|nr:hypothetical protein NIES2100_29100 [Calothrix sp. NIES-2100]
MEVKDLAGISEPLKRLIEVIAEGIGAVSRPYLIKKNAEAKAYEIRVISEAMAENRKLLGGADYEDGKIKMLASSETPSQILSLPERVTSRSEYQELRKQQNIESICANAAEELANKSEIPENKPEPEWINHFFDIAEKISTEDLQYWWGKILAGEITEPGSFSLRTLETVKNLSRQEAENFVKLVQYVLNNRKIAFYLDPQEYIFKKNNTITFPEILSLREAGLITDSDFINFSFEASISGTTSRLFYSSLVLLFEREKDTPKIENKVGLLTKAGTELLKLISGSTDMEYIKFVAQKLKRDGMKVAWAPIAKDDGELIYIGDKTYLDTEESA